MTQNSEHTPASADLDPTVAAIAEDIVCLLYTSPSPRD